MAGKSTTKGDYAKHAPNALARDLKDIEKHREEIAAVWQYVRSSHPEPAPAEKPSPLPEGK